MKKKFASLENYHGHVNPTKNNKKLEKMNEIQNVIISLNCNEEQVDREDISSQVKKKIK